MSDTETDFSQGKGGPVIPPEPGKTRITIRIDTDVLDWFREKVNAAGGGNYQSNVNDALRAYMRAQEETDLESILRRVIREELKSREAA